MAWIGQKTDPQPTPHAPPAPGSGRQVVPPSPPMESRSRTEMTTVANIGKSLQIKGEVSGDEDLTVEGKVEGKITLNGHSVTIGPNGRVMAEVRARSVVVGGQLRGNVTADDKVEILATGTVLGDVRAPRVVLADGAHFKGTIDMETRSGDGGRAAATVSGGASRSAGAPPSQAPVPVTAAKP